MLTALFTGLGIGLLAASSVGPIWLLCARTSARYGFAPGAAIGIGAAAVDLGYSVLGALGATALLQATALRLALGLLGGGVLVWLGTRTVLSAVRIRLGGEADVEVVTVGAALRTGLIATASNPLTIIIWGAVFSGAAVARVAGNAPAAAVFTVAIGLGSLLLHLGLAGVMSLIGARLGVRALRMVDLAAGIGLVFLGGLLGIRSAERA